jgi:type I restriction enzyme R subunit
MTPQPELDFQKHIADFLVREHKYGVLEQAEITDPEYAIAEDHLWAFLQDTQPEAIKRLIDEYGTDARDEIFRALKRELAHTPLWMLMRHGLNVRGVDVRLFFPQPRSSESEANKLYNKNRITVRPHYYFGETNKEIDIVLFLNGLPIIAIELKHEKNQNVHDAVGQFTKRDHAPRIFQLPFLYIAADTSDVMVATDPRREENFRWLNTGLTNEPETEGEYPIEYLYREVLSKERILEAIAFFLIRVPHQEAEADRAERAAFTLFPRYHQSRTVRKVAADALVHFSSTGNVGKKYLISHSAGSGKTLSICWLADRLHSLFKTGTSEKLVDMVFILTDRKSLDKNIRDEIENFVHLKDIAGIARRAGQLEQFVGERRSIIVTTQQKFAWILEALEQDAGLKQLRVAFLIDEAHRSQEGNLGAAIRKPFRESGGNAQKGDAEAEVDEDDEIARIIHEHDHNQLFVAFTATPSPATVTLFGAPFDMYTEAEAIAEGYIVDVATSIISYDTLYNLHCRVVPTESEERLYPKGVVAKALKNVAYQDDGLIQYKAEVMLRIFDENVRSLIGGRSKAMIVTSSRVAGLRYFEVIKEKLRERKADYKVLYAFSDFTHPLTNEAVSEHAINGLAEGEQIEDRFEGDDYRLMVVASKFQTGFDQPLLAGMFIDKPVFDRNAVQTLSRLNRCHEGKGDVVVVDFTNNAKGILKAFAKYRKGTPFEPGEPDVEECPRLYQEIMAKGVFLTEDVRGFLTLVEEKNDANIQARVSALRAQFQTRISDPEERKEFVYLLARFVKSFHFLTCFVTFAKDVSDGARFAEYVGPQLIKQGTVSELMKLIRETEVTRASVKYVGEQQGGGTIKTRSGVKGGEAPPIKKVSVQDMINEIRERYEITDQEALYIRQVTEERAKDPDVRQTVEAHKEVLTFLRDTFKGQVNGQIQGAYAQLQLFDELADPKYIETGAIFDIMAYTVLQQHLSSV